MRRMRVSGEAWVQSEPEPESVGENERTPQAQSLELRPSHCQQAAEGKGCDGYPGLTSKEGWRSSACVGGV